jgi:hypothetical protein
MLSPGDQIWLAGGYEMEPRWLLGGNGYSAVVLRYFDDEHRQKNLLVGLQKPITLKGVTGSILCLTLRYEGAKWCGEEVVHVSLCSEEPRMEGPAQDKSKFAWVESHANYRLVSKGSRG